MKMKFAKSILLLSLSTALVSCGGGDNSNESKEEDKTSATETSTANHTVDTSTAPVSTGGLKIAYVNSDTLTVHYDYYKVLIQDLQAKQTSAEYTLKGMMKDYEEKVAYYQKNQPMIGQQEAQRLIQEIGMLEQEIYQKEQELSVKLQEKNLYESIDYREKTSQYMQVIGKQLGYDFILSYRTGDVVMYADEKYDITYQMIDLLNEEYNKEKNGE